MHAKGLDQKMIDVAVSTDLSNQPYFVMPQTRQIAGIE